MCDQKFSTNIDQFYLNLIYCSSTASSLARMQWLFYLCNFILLDACVHVSFNLQAFLLFHLRKPMCIHQILLKLFSLTYSCFFFSLHRILSPLFSLYYTSIIEICYWSDNTAVSFVQCFYLYIVNSNHYNLDSPFDQRGMHFSLCG